MEDCWKTIQQRYDNSVMQLNVNVAHHNVMRPYMGFEDQSTSGSSFFIDSKKGILLTNAHVVSNALSITGTIGLMGKLKIPIEIQSICNEKDLAIVRISDDKILEEIHSKLNNPNDLTMSLGDSLMLAPTDKVLVIGYPLGERNVKYTTGIVSGIHTDETGFSTNFCEDVYPRDPTYITITAPLNPGVSGGPLLSSNGTVVGINAAGRMKAQNIGYAISIRVFYSIFGLMKTQLFPKLPNFNFRWNSMNDDTRDFLTKKSSEDKTGIYIRKVLPDSVLDGLIPGDILQMISFSIPTIVEEIKLETLLDKSNHETVIGVFDNLGEITLYKGGVKNRGQRLLNRNILISEFVDLIPVNSKIKLVFNRKGKIHVGETIYKYTASNRIKGVFPEFDRIEWFNIGGICITPLTLNHMGGLVKFHLLNEDKHTDDFMYDDHLLVNQIFPSTDASISGTFCEGDLLLKVNGYDVKTIADVKKYLNSTIDGYVTLENESGGFIAMNKQTLKRDNKIVERYLKNESGGLMTLSSKEY